MPYYRLYFLRDEHIRHVVELDCVDDLQAIDTVADHADGRTMELWRREILVRRFEARAPASSHRGGLGKNRVRR